MEYRIFYRCIESSLRPGLNISSGVDGNLIENIKVYMRQNYGCIVHVMKIQLSLSIYREFYHVYRSYICSGHTIPVSIKTSDINTEKKQQQQRATDEC